MNEKKLIYDLESIANTMIGTHGGSYITGTSEITPDEGYTFFAIQALEETEIDEVLGNIIVDGAVIPELGIIYGQWTSIKLTSGSCIAYQKETT